MPIVTGLLAAIAVLGWIMALKKRKVQPAVQPKAPTQWMLQTSDRALNTRFGPVILRTFEARETYSGMKGFIIFPSGAIVNEHFNALLQDVLPMHSLNNESLPGVPNSYRVWTRNHTADEQFGTVLEAVAEIVNGRVGVTS